MLKVVMVFVMLFSLQAYSALVNENEQFKILEIEKGLVVLMTSDDFYSPSAEIFGPPYYSWPLTKHDPHEKMLIQYVIYQNVNLDALKRKFKIDPIAKQDYRYIRFEDAIHYLDDKIAQLYKDLNERESKRREDSEGDLICANWHYVTAYEMLAVYNKTALFLAKHFQYAAPK